MIRSQEAINSKGGGGDRSAGVVSEKEFSARTRGSRQPQPRNTSVSSEASVIKKSADEKGFTGVDTQDSSKEVMLEKSTESNERRL